MANSQISAGLPTLFATEGTLMKYQRPRNSIAAIAMGMCATLLAGSLSIQFSTSTAVAATGRVSGKVFVDGGADGEMNGSDVGAGGLVVRAFDSTGAEVGTATTATNGTYTLNVASSASNALRIEFPTPTGFQSTIVSGTGAGSSIQFVQLGATNVNYAFFSPADYCQATMSLASVCINQGSKDISSTDRAVGLSSFEPASTGSTPVAVDQTAAAVASISKKGDVGATWGLGWQKTNHLLWNSAVIRRHAGLGPKGLGGVYVHNLSGTQIASFDLTTDLGANSLTLKGASDDYSDAARDIVTDITAAPTRQYVVLSRDVPGYSGVGTAGIGDLDISHNSQHMWVTNLYQRKIHRIAIGGTSSSPTLGAVQGWEISNGHSCVNNTGPLRPWGIDTNADGSIVVAAVCANEAADPLTKPLPGDGVILKLDPTKPNDATAWTLLTTIDFSYAQKYDYCATAAGFTCTWKAWTNDWTALQSVAKTGSQYWWTQPMIVDIEQLADGSFALGISDRLSYQLGSANYAPLSNANSANTTGWTAGDTLLVCKTSTGWQQESNGGCAGVNNYSNAHGSTTEFFYDSFGHPETTIGGLALGRSQLAVSAMDPASYYLSGVRWVSTFTGKQTNGLDMTSVANSAGATGFGKSAGMGDLEALCDEAPLQIGNRVWYDYNHDGFQDADEDPVVGITVRLYDSSQNLVGTAITNAKGEYYFTSSNTEAANGGPTLDEFGGGLTADTTYNIVLDNPDDCAVGKPLEGWILTLNDQTATGSTPERDNLIDSDATAVGATWCGDKAATVPVTAMSVGGVNHSYDIGFWKEGGQPTAAAVIKVSVGDYVWWDMDRDGIQDSKDIPIAGVTLTITKADGSAVVDVDGNPVTTTKTDVNGKYSFDNLPPGQYTVTVIPPPGALTTKAEVGSNREKNSSTTSSTSVVLTTNGQRDPSLDFGFYKPRVSVGNFVWRDVKGDGYQNRKDKGLAGFKLTLRTVDGKEVTDIYGKTVQPIITKADGKYLFTDLPEGQYKVLITYRRGFRPTTPNRPNRHLNSSTSFAVSQVLTDGQSDLSLDFGVVGSRGNILPITR